eukprot:CAMPEP_0178995722 /NCGR_PEP_ID=MMETSP0795-20121207/7970_1 /TAXON_ID=88552 /ORGANISM="Amoebophrya sp., Strain Ameob2" /LENGTH=178 /DNA_ID=CAMNT_0020688031 /DNA_START=353 /DNA_END=887 /DNA_ORIENTATION=+
MAYRKNGLRIDDLHSVKLDGLSEDVKAEELEEAFSKFGEVQDCYIPRDFRSGRGKGFGFVRFQHRDQAEDAAAAEIVIDGHKLETTLATRGKRDMSFRDREDVTEEKVVAAGGTPAAAPAPGVVGEAAATTPADAGVVAGTRRVVIYIICSTRFFQRGNRRTRRMLEQSAVVVVKVNW